MSYVEPLPKSRNRLADPSITYASSGKVRWRYRSARPMVAAVTTTAGGMGGGIVSYEVKGRQFIAAASGRSGFWFGQTGAPTLFVFALPASGR